MMDSKSSYQHDIAWAAGFFDGEGTVMVEKREGRRKSATGFVRLDVAQITPTPLLKFQRLFGGCVGLRPSCNAIYRWSACHNKAAAALTAMLPYLQVKADEVRIALAFWSQRNTVKGPAANIRPLSDITKARRDIQRVRSKRKADLMHAVTRKKAA